MNPPDFRHRWKLEDGTDVTIRPIQPEDAAIEQDFVRSLSPLSKRMRFFSPIKELSPATLWNFTHTDYPNNMALIATVDDCGAEREIGVARFAPGSRDGWVEFAIAVADEWQNRGIGTELLRNLFNIAVEAEIEGVEGFVLRENKRMLLLTKELGFNVQSDRQDPLSVHVCKAF